MRTLTNFVLIFASCLLPLVFLFRNQSGSRTGLKLSYGRQGVEQLNYDGTPLLDLNQHPADGFHIWHMKMTDLNGNLLTTAQYGWGENNSGRHWDAASHTWFYSFVWGSIQVQFLQMGDRLDMKVTERNLSGSGVILYGAVIYPIVLRFPQLPSGFGDSGYSHLAYNTTGPSVTLADFGSGEVASVVPDPTRPLYSGFQRTGADIAYTAIISGTSLDGLATFEPHVDRPVAPGQTDSFTVSLRFAPSLTAVSTLAADIYSNWARSWPSQLNWPDRRIVGTVYLASSGQGNPNQSVGFANNPRRYFYDSTPSDFDVRTTEGLAAFQKRILQKAQAVVGNLHMLNAQGAITWDIEGEQYPQETSYVCSPDQIARVAPEMESIVTDPTSAYAGMKLDDAYFKTIRNAGFRVGVCIRPQHFTLNKDGTAGQIYLPNSSVKAEIVRKMHYAHDRWGATLFYIDSAVESNGAVLDASIFQQAALAIPDSLLIPEQTTPADYAYVAAFQTFLFHRDLGTDTNVYNYYPKAFSANLINDADASVLAQYRPQLTQSVRRGDILMAHADYWPPSNTTVVQIYAEASVGRASSLPIPQPSTH